MSMYRMCKWLYFIKKDEYKDNYNNLLLKIFTERFKTNLLIFFNIFVFREQIIAEGPLPKPLNLQVQFLLLKQDTMI